jgi:hypothetical protein
MILAIPAQHSPKEVSRRILLSAQTRDAEDGGGRLWEGDVTLPVLAGGCHRLVIAGSEEYLIDDITPTDKCNAKRSTAHLRRAYRARDPMMPRNPRL